MKSYKICVEADTKLMPHTQSKNVFKSYQNCMIVTLQPFDLPLIINKKFQDNNGNML